MTTLAEIQMFATKVRHGGLTSSKNKMVRLAGKHSTKSSMIPPSSTHMKRKKLETTPKLRNQDKGGRRYTCTRDFWKLANTSTKIPANLSSTKGKDYRRFKEQPYTTLVSGLYALRKKFPSIIIINA